MISFRGLYQKKGNWFSIKYSAQLLFLILFSYFTYKALEDPTPNLEDEAFRKETNVKKLFKKETESL
jgi:hypothetical protein